MQTLWGGGGGSVTSYIQVCGLNYKTFYVPVLGSYHVPIRILCSDLTTISVLVVIILTHKF